jgi:hypothetical protein
MRVIASNDVVVAHGELSNFFYRLSNFRKAIGIKANIEMLYLADEMFKQRGKKMLIRIGKPIMPADLDLNMNERALAQQIKEKVYQMEIKS